MCASKFIGLAEESTYGSAGSTRIDFKILNETIGTTRNDYYAETTEFWTPDVKTEGYFTGGGDAVIPVEPVQFPKLLVFFMGDPSSSVITDSAYTHVFKFGANEAVSSSAVKAFTITKGVGIEKDRRFDGGFIEGLNIECRARELVTSTVNFVHSGNETLQTAGTPSYTNYAQPYFSFSSAATMTIGEADRLTTAPTIENFTVNFNRGIDKDHYVLGARYLAAQTLSGFASVSGSMDLTFSSEDEHERFLTAVAGAETGDQTSFEIILLLQGALIGSASKYGIQVNIPEAHYTLSDVNVTGRDRIVQTVNYRGNYNSTDECAAFVTVTNITESYTSLS